MTTEELDQFLEQSPRAQKAMAAFYDGYNCAQAIVLAFEDLLPLEHQSDDAQLFLWRGYGTPA